MMNTESYYFLEDYLVPVYNATEDTQWVTTFGGQQGGHSFRINLIAVRATRGAERESMRASIANDIATHQAQLEQKPDDKVIQSNIKYLARLSADFDTVNEKPIRYIRTQWKEINNLANQALIGANLRQFDINKAVFFSGIIGSKGR